jgi:hypothetical protein
MTCPSLERLWLGSGARRVQCSRKYAESRSSPRLIARLPSTPTRPPGDTSRTRQEMSDLVVIVGAGQAASQLGGLIAQRRFRRRDHRDRRRASFALPQRPPLSKAFLKGEMRRRSPLCVEPAEFDRDAGCTLELSTRATAIDRSTRALTLS